MNWILGITLAFLAFLLIETLLLQHARLGVPCRIVVTGTRGKSSLVRLLVAGIRTTEPSTWGKITGDIPLLLLPSGAETIINRRGPARLHEQARLLFRCRREGVRCLVQESMTISPEAMGAEMRLIKPSLVVITNVRDDHRETLGTDPDQQRVAYLAALPDRCRWLSLDNDLLTFAALNKRFPAPLDLTEAVSGPRDGDMFAVTQELLATAEAVLTELGRNTDAARQAMATVAEKLVHPPRTVSFLGRAVLLLDAFSANDPQSLTRLWTRWRQDLAAAEPWPVLLATRADRPLRTRQFCDWLAARTDIGVVHVAGTHRETAARLLRRHGVTVRELKSNPLAIPVGDAPRGVVVGLGNAHGIGLSLRAAAREMEA